MPQHPHLFFNSEQIEGLRIKALGASCLRLWSSIQATAVQRLDWKPYQPRLIPLDAVAGNSPGSAFGGESYQAAYVEHYRLAMMLRNQAELQSFTYLVGGDRRHLVAAEAWASFACSWTNEQWEAYSRPASGIRFESDTVKALERSGAALVSGRADGDASVTDARFADSGIFTTFKLRGMAMAYDWIGSELNETTRRALGNTIAAQCRRLYALAKAGKGLLIRHRLNHTWMDVSAFGLAALSLLDEEPDADEWVSFARSQLLDRLIPETIGIDGEFPEPGPYVWEYALMNALLFLEALSKTTGEAIAIDGLRKVAQFLVAMRNPTGGLAFDEDMTGYDRAEGVLTALRPVMLRLASHFHDPRAQWFALGGGQSPLGSADGKLYPGGPWYQEEREYGGHWELLWFNPELPFTSPPVTPGGIGTISHCRDIGFVTLRTGWGPESLYVAMRSGPFLGPHDRLDQNKIVLYALGERFLEHLYGGNYGHYEYFKNTPGTNSILVDGKGQLGASHGARHQRFESEYKTDKTSGRIVTVEAAQTHLLAVGDASGAYHAAVRRCVRLVAIVDRDVVVLVDQLEGTSDVEWSLLFHSTGRIEVEGRKATIWKAGGRLQLEHFVSSQTGDWTLRRTPPDNYGRRLEQHLELGVKGRQVTTVVVATVLEPGQRAEAMAARFSEDSHLISVTKSESWQFVVDLQDYRVRHSAAPGTPV